MKIQQSHHHSGDYNNDNCKLEDNLKVIETNTAEILLSLKESNSNNTTIPEQQDTQNSSQTNKFTDTYSTASLDYLNGDPCGLYLDGDEDKPLDLRTTNGVQQGLTEESLLLILKQNNVIDIIKHKNCMICGIAFSGLLELAKHACQKLVEKDYNCPKCNHPYRTNANLHSHLRWCGKPSTKRMNKKKTFSEASSPSTSSTSSRYSQNLRLTSPGIDLSVSPSYRVT